ncbi:RHS repeat-associated core domain-containing protein [Epilithonimonas hungarica]|uniref:RHS repeat-associated core domain-containing protein n=1 Tax=Epilithonimonas hungarica TaxID=454006 RepID=A0A1G7LMZ6_9FLAO|nr:RHS repeat-associated core domain-containing protein [Epilithonimonas hungarica]SDF50744.1 RHS repeat-associated core domain-containing protein [Epilithonimonas hungarica]
MRSSLSIIFFFVSVILFSQTLTEIPLEYDTSGYAENNQTGGQNIISATNLTDPLAPTVNAEMNVNESGALTYMLPIELLKGVNSFQPNIALSYNSQSGNGQAGWGWNIVGLSTINRGGKSKEVDGVTRGPQFNDSDPFYLDGQRLLKITDNEYVTEIFSKIKITKQTAGEYQFIVKYTDGRIAKYKELVTGQYYISTIVDALDNQIHYTYEVANNVPVLTKISYGGANVATDKFYVNFLYKARRYNIKIFRNEIEFINSRILYEINTGSIYNALYRKYSLVHDYISENSIERVVEVDVENDEGAMLKPLIFKYNVTNAAKITLGQGSNGFPLGIGYYNNPRPQDVVGLGSATVGNFTGKNLEAVYQVKLRNGSYGVQSSRSQRFPNLSTSSSSTFYSGKTLGKIGQIKDNDQLITVKVNYLDNANTDNEYDSVNDNLRDEVNFITQDLKTGEQITVKYILKGGLISRENFHANDDPYSDPDGGTPHNPSYIYRRDTSERTLVSGDFNNDGLIDFLVYETANFNRPAKLYFLEVGKKTPVADINQIPVSLGNLSIENKDVYPIEMDGDGISELMVVSKYSWKYDVYKIDFQQNTLTALLTDQTLSHFGNDTPIYFGDFNGDGLTDFLTPQRVYEIPKDEDSSGTKIGAVFYNIEHDNLLWWKYTSNGKQFLKAEENYTEQKIFYLKPSQNNVIKRSTFWQKFWDGQPDEYAYTRYATQNIIITDFDGDGRSDIMTLNKVGRAKYDADGRLAEVKVENLGNTFFFRPNFKCVNPNYPYNTVNYVLAPNQCAAPLVAMGLTVTEILTNTQGFSSSISNQVNLYLNKNLQGGTFTKKKSESVTNLVISPLSLVLSNTDFNRLNVYKSGFYIHDPVARFDTRITVNNESFLETQIQEVDNSSSVVQKVEYRNMAQAIDPDLLSWGIERDYYEELTYIFNPQQELKYPYYTHNSNGSYYMVNKVHTLFDNKILTKEYRFENGIQNLEGKGFLGFQKTYISDPYESTFSNGKYRVKDPVKAIFWNIQTKDPLMDNSVIKSTYGGIKKFFTENYSVNQKFKIGNQYIILSTQESSVDNLKKIFINKRYDFDPNDDFKLKFAYTDYNSIGSTKASYTYKPEFTSGDHYFYGKIETSENITYRDGLSFTTRETNNYFNNGLISEVYKYSNDPNAPPIITSYEYYNNGNLKKETLSVSGLSSQSTSYEYDDTQRYINKTTTPDGLSSVAVINALGRMSEETSSLGLKTYYTHDSWGNVAVITDYLGKKTTISKTGSGIAGGVYDLSKKREGGTESIITFDKFDREIQSKTQSTNGKWIVAKTEYDLFGRKIRFTEPYFEGETQQWNEIKYDELNRPTENKLYTGKVIKTCYEGMMVTVDDGYKKTSKTMDAMGNVIRQQDHGGIIGFSYFPNGALRETDYDGIKTTFEIDGWGNKTKITDPSAGIFEYRYDNLSRIIREENPKGYTLYTYDSLGRPETEKSYGKTAAENTAIEKTYTYNANTKLPEKITGTSNGKTFTYTTVYDQYFRIMGKVEQTPEFTYTTSSSIDAFGRTDIISSTIKLNSLNYTTPITLIKNIYDSNGILVQQNDPVTAKMVWHISDINARGQIKQMEYGNGHTITNSYRGSDNSLTDIRHVNNTTGISVVDIGYDYNMDKGILNSRNNRTFNKSEEYNYDKLNRLLTETLNGTLVNEYTYDPRGRMTSNSELGKYNYNTGDYKLQNIAFNTNGHSVNTQRGFASTTYNAFKSPLNITLAGKENLNFEYNILKSRYSMASTVTGVQKFYSSDFAVEIIKNGNRTEIINYLTGDPYSANYIKKTVLNGSSVVPNETACYFLHRDNIGSIVAITKAADGAVVEQRYFDAWGNIKALLNSSGSLITDSQQLSTYNYFIDRGYTGHEHLWKAGLINMNARLYDPILRKFLSADKLVSDPFNTQAYDRYSYVLNNPLLNVDLDGNEAISLGVAVIIAVGVAIFGKAIANMIQGIPFWYGMGKAATMGAIAGAVSFGIGSVATSAFGQLLTVGKAAFEAGMHAISSGLMSAADGGKFGSGFWSGLISSAMASSVQSLGINFGASTRNNVVYNSFGKDMMKATMIAVGGFSGGISSAIAGGSFWKGFQQGLITSGLNHVAHLGVAAIEKDKMQKFLEKNGIDPNAPATEETLIKLKEIFKSQYWDESVKWTEFANDQTMAEWSRDYLKVGYNEKGNLSTINKDGVFLDDADGITSPTSGKVLLSCGLLRYTNWKLALTFVHEQVHSMDFVSGLTSFFNRFGEIGSDAIEARAYMEVAKWNGGFVNAIGTNHITNSIGFLSVFSSMFRLY